MQWTAQENSAAVGRMLQQPDPAATLRIKALGKDDSSLLLQFLASEQNRYNFEIWEISQVVLAGLFFFFLLFGTDENKFSLALALVLLVMVLVQRFVLTPEIYALGRLTDFVQPPGMAGERAKRHVMEYGYLGVEIAKWAIQVGLAAILISRGRSRSSLGSVASSARQTARQTR